MLDTNEACETRLQELHAMRGAACDAGQSTVKINAEIVAIHQRQAELADAESYRVQKEREAAANKRQGDITAVRTEIADLDASSRRALTQAEAALREAVKAQRLHHTHEAAKRKAIAKLNQLTEAKQVIESEFELYRKGSRLWLAQLNTLTSAPGQYGDLKFPSLHLPSPSKSWS